MILRENKKAVLKTAFCYRPAIKNLEDFSFFHKGFVDSFYVTFMVTPENRFQQVMNSAATGANHKAVNTVNLHAAESGNQNQIVRHFGVFTYQRRAQDIVHQPNDDHKEANDKQPLP